MKIFVKTLKGSRFEVQVNLTDKIADVKKSIENTPGESVYPALQQILIHQGKILKDDTTVEDNKIAENSFVVIMLNKTKAPTSEIPATARTSSSSAVIPNANIASPNPSTPIPAPSQTPAVTQAPSALSVDSYGQAASALVAGANLEGSIQEILDMGGGTWDKDTVIRALRAAFNNPERAVEYLYSGIHVQTESPVAASAPTTSPAPNFPSQVANAQPVQPAFPSSGPNANPLNLFPQVLPSAGDSAASTGSLDFLRDNPQFRALQAMVQGNPQILLPMLQELGKQNPMVMRVIQEHQAEFLRLLNEPTEGGESNLPSLLASAAPQAIQVTPEEHEAIERLEAMGFEQSIVLEAYLACNKNEELAANYLLDHMHEFEE